MKTKSFKYLKNFEYLIVDRLDTLFDTFVKKVESKFIYESENLYWIETRLINKNNSRCIKIIIDEGLNADKLMSRTISLSIFNTPVNEIASSFSIEDFCTSQGFNLTWKSIFQEADEFAIGIDTYLTQAAEVLNNEVLKSVLLDNLWIKVPPNCFPYK